ncbi:MAG: hypothetical protein WCE61_11840 [Candidatus Acidiferrum sp.]
MRETKTLSCMGGLTVTVAALAVNSYYVRELLVSLALFSVAFLILAAGALVAILAWWASEQATIWTEPASRSVVAFSRRLLAAYAKR